MKINTLKFDKDTKIMQDLNHELTSAQVASVILNKIRSIGMDFFRRFGGRIKYGPLTGFTMHAQSSWSKTDLAAKLLGLYEQEVLRSISDNKNLYETAIVLGAADGYYAVGLVYSGIVSNCVCFESSAHGREIIKQTAVLNGLESKIVIHGLADSDFIRILNINEEKLKKCIFIVDIEGGEFSIFTQEVLNNLRNSHLIIELHGEMMSNGMEAERTLIERLHTYFCLNVLTTGGRDLSQIEELSGIGDNLRWLVCSEGRPYRMRWVHCGPKDRPNTASEDIVIVEQPAPLSVETMIQNHLFLLYLCAFGEMYFKEAMICIKSWRKIGEYVGEIVLFCDKIWRYHTDLDDEIRDLGIKVVVIDNRDAPIRPRDAAAYRLKIFEHVKEQKIFFYCDTDILCIKKISLPDLLSSCDLQKINVYGYEGRNQNNKMQAAFVTDDKEILAQKAICSGFIIFTHVIKEEFAEILERYLSQKEVNGCWEQPMFNYVVLKNKSVCIALDKFFVEERALGQTDKDTAILNHYCGLRGGDRFYKMRTRLDRLISKA